MTIDRLALEESVAQTRAVAFSGALPVALFTHSPLLAPRLTQGSVLPARLRTRDETGGAFLETETGEDLFLKSAPPAEVSLGSALQVQVIAEARTGKAARVRLWRERHGPPPASPLETWRAGLPGAQDHGWETAASAEIDAAFDEALSPLVTLPGGGRLQIARTPALTAVDVDTAGRPRSGKPRAHALTVNKEAAAETARQLALRGIGGLAVIDCIAPLSPETGKAVKAAFLATFRAICARKAEALAPSPFGLMEAQLAWGPAPLEDLLAGAHATALAGLRQLEREARASPGDRLHLDLPPAAYETVKSALPALHGALAARYGARLEVRCGARDQIEVHVP